MKKKHIILAISSVILLSLVGLFFIRNFNDLSEECGGYTLDNICYERGRSRLLEYVEKSIQSDNINICNDINFGSDNTDYTSPPSSNQSACRLEFIISKGDINDCKGFEDYLYNKCIAGIAVLKHDKSICDEIILDSSYYILHKICLDKAIDPEYVRHYLEY